ncbi:MAG: hypothetical protein AAF322_00195, partial [Pseudomonadota bacterium]
MLKRRRRLADEGGAIRTPERVAYERGEQNEAAEGDRDGGRPKVYYKQSAGERLENDDRQHDDRRLRHAKIRELRRGGRVIKRFRDGAEKENGRQHEPRGLVEAIVEGFGVFR